MTATATTTARTHEQREEMLMQVQRAIRAEVRRARIPERHIEDVTQDCQVAVWEASAKFDPARGTKWSTYAIGTIKNMLMNWKTHNNIEFLGSIQQKDSEFFDRLSWPQHIEPLSHEEDDDDDEDWGQLVDAVRRELVGGWLEPVS